MFHEYILRKYLFKSKVIRLHFYTANVEYLFISNTFRNTYIGFHLGDSESWIFRLDK